MIHSGLEAMRASHAPGLPLQAFHSSVKVLLISVRQHISAVVLRSKGKGKGKGKDPSNREPLESPYRMSQWGHRLHPGGDTSYTSPIFVYVGVKDNILRSAFFL